MVMRKARGKRAEATPASAQISTNPAGCARDLHSSLLATGGRNDCAASFPIESRNAEGCSRMGSGPRERAKLV